MATLSLYRGDTATWRFAVSGVDQEGAQGVFDLTNCDIFFTAKVSRSQADVDAIISFDSDEPENIDIDDPTNGRFLLTIRPADTINVSMTADTKEMVYDVQVVTAGGDVYTVDTGTVVITRDVTVRTT
jgi:hypothetical protein